jgi:hypothetical protein
MGAASVAMLGVTLVVFAFTASLTGYVFERLLTSHTPPGARDRAESRSVDRPPGGRPVGGVDRVPISRSWGQSAVTWWDGFWNHSVPTAYVGTDGDGRTTRSVAVASVR